MFTFNFNLPNSSDDGQVSHAKKYARDDSIDTMIHITKGLNKAAPPSITSTPLQILDIHKLKNNINYSPEKWHSDVIYISNMCSLRRIDIARKPFGAALSSSKDEMSRQTIQQTDLIPGYYEGGSKLWECSVDLCSYLAEQISSFYGDSSKERSNDVRCALSREGSTLELGCGHGLPAIMILKEILREPWKDTQSAAYGQVRGNYTSSIFSTKFSSDEKTANELMSDSAKVFFTDYNGFVLRDVTLPNIILNTSEDQGLEDRLNRLSDIENSFGLISGDWLELSEQMKAKDGNLEKIPSDGKFDLILASETTYTPKSSHDTAYLLMNHLRPFQGIGLVATKRYYFGVGGGSEAFVEASKKLRLHIDGKVHHLSVELVRQYDNGKSNIRDLWRARCLPIP